MRFDRLVPASLGIASALVITVPAEAAQLQSWWFDARENQLVFATDTGVQPRAQLIFNPTRIVIDLPGTTLSGPPTRQAVGGAIREVRSGQFDAQTSRLVIELNPGFSLDPRAIQVRGISSNRWIVQLPNAERSDNAPVTPNAPVTTPGNSVNGQFNQAAETYLNGILATPDGFFISTRGEVPEVQVERRSDRDRQIIISLPNTSITPLLRAEKLPVNRYGVASWEVTQDSQPTTARITMTLAPESPDWEITSASLRGIVLLPPPGISISSIPDQPPTPSTNQPINVPRSPEQPSIPPRPQIPTEPPRVNTRQLLVAIDPGHGGRDPGAVGIGGLQEKNVVFPVSLRVAEILREQGIQVVMTRSDDRTLDLQPRVDIANRANATIFLSIHANAISLSRPDVNGVETYYTTEDGRRLASIIHANVLPASGLRDRGVKQARFYVLRQTAMPAALVELGFLTGQEDITRLRDPNWQERMAQAIAQGILQYLQPLR